MIGGIFPWSNRSPSEDCDGSFAGAKKTVLRAQPSPEILVICCTEAHFVYCDGALGASHTMAGPYQRRAKPCKRGTFDDRPPSNIADIRVARMLPTIHPNRPKPRPTDDFRCETARSNYTPNHVSAQIAQAPLLINLALKHRTNFLTTHLRAHLTVRPEATTLAGTRVVTGVQAGENKSTPTYQLPVRGN